MADTTLNATTTIEQLYPNMDNVISNAFDASGKLTDMTGISALANGDAEIISALTALDEDSVTKAQITKVFKNRFKALKKQLENALSGGGNPENKDASAYGFAFEAVEPELLHEGVKFIATELRIYGKVRKSVMTQEDYRGANLLGYFIVKGQDGGFETQEFTFQTNTRLVSNSFSKISNVSDAIEKALATEEPKEISLINIDASSEELKMIANGEVPETLMELGVGFTVTATRTVAGKSTYETNADEMIEAARKENSAFVKFDAQGEEYVLRVHTKTRIRSERLGRRLTRSAVRQLTKQLASAEEARTKNFEQHLKDQKAAELEKDKVAHAANVNTQNQLDATKELFQMMMNNAEAFEEKGVDLNKMLETALNKKF